MRVALALAGSALAVAGPAAAAPPDVIRTGGPSRPPDAKVAVVATARNLAGKSFRVLDATGATVLRGKLTRAPGSRAPWKRAALADFAAVSAPGSYRIAIGRLRSRPWVVDDDAPSLGPANRRVSISHSTNMNVRGHMNPFDNGDPSWHAAALARAATASPPIQATIFLPVPPRPAPAAGRA